MVGYVTFVLTQMVGKFIEFIKSFALAFSPPQIGSQESQLLLNDNSKSLSAGKETNPIGSNIEENKLGDSDIPPHSHDSHTPPVYFQSWQVNIIELKIDYTPNQVLLLLINLLFV